MSKPKIRDEFTEHYEGQAVFTLRRVIFGAVLVCAAVAIGTWILIGEPS